MNWCFLWISLTVFSVYLKNTDQCSPPEGWWPMQPKERAERAEIVVFGTVVSDPERNHSLIDKGRFYSIILHVHCVVKGPKLPEFLHVSGFSNFNGGLCVHSKALMNKSYVIFLKRDVDNPEKFRVLEVNLQKGAVHPGHKLFVLRDVMLLTGENASLPLGVKNFSKPGCPLFKRKLRDPASVKSKHHKPCQCRKKKKKRKKRKRIKLKTTKRPRNHKRNLTDVPTLPRTRRYNVVNFDQDNVSKVRVRPPSSKTVPSSTSTDSHQFNALCFWWLLTLNCVVVWLLPT